MTAETIDLLATGRLGPLPAAFLRGEARELLAPLRFVLPGDEASIQAPEVDRAALASELAQANAAYGHPRAEELAERLADPATLVVITGQQPGLFGGPLYSLSKAMAACRWAEALQAAGRPAVALFWVATEDHDWSEVSRATLLPDADLLEAGLGEDPAPLTPMGMRTLGSGIESVFAAAAERAAGDRYQSWLDRLGSWYRPDARFGEAFCRLMAALLPGGGPLFVDSQLAALKRAQRPWLERLVTRREAVREALAAAHERIEAKGFPLQVRPQPEAGPFFVLHGGRRKVLWQGADHFQLRGTEESRPVEELLAILEDNPAAVSPGVLARPAIQDAVLGSALQILGPGEMAYFAQAAALYPVLGVAPPAVALRPQLLLLDRRQREHLEGLEITAAELTDPEADLDALLTRGRGVDPGPEAAAAADALLAALREKALAVDPNLERGWEKTRDQVHRALEQLSSRVVAAAARGDEIRRRRLESLRTAACPDGAPQERRLAVAHFPGRYGEDFAHRLQPQLSLDPRAIQILDPSEGD